MADNQGNGEKSTLITDMTRIAHAAGAPLGSNGKIEDDFYKKTIVETINEGNKTRGDESPFLNGIVALIGQSKDRQATMDAVIKAGLGDALEKITEHHGMPPLASDVSDNRVPTPTLLGERVQNWVNNNPSLAQKQTVAQQPISGKPLETSQGKPSAAQAPNAEASRPVGTPPLKGSGLMAAAMNDQNNAEMARDAERRETERLTQQAQQQAQQQGHGAGGDGGRRAGLIEQAVNNTVGGLVTGVIGGVRAAIGRQRAIAAEAVANAGNVPSAEARNALLRLNSNSVRVAQQSLLASIEGVKNSEAGIMEQSKAFEAARNAEFAARQELGKLSASMFPQAPETLLEIADKAQGDVNKGLVSMGKGKAPTTLPEMTKAIQTQAHADFVRKDLAVKSLDLQASATNHAETMKSSFDYLDKHGVIPEKDRDIYFEDIDKASKRLDQIAEKGREIREGMNVPHAAEEDSRLDAAREAIRAVVERIVESIRNMFGHGKAAGKENNAAPAASRPGMSM